MTRYSRVTTHFKAAASVLALVAATSAAGAARAADASATLAAATPDASQVGEVVVTARKREERLQDVPIPMTAFNQAAIASKAAADLTALSDSIPNVKLETVGLFPNASSFTMRGIGTSGVESFQDPRVALYIDGAYQSRVQSGPGDMFDVDTVEILRGPQGALYGRNAFAGAMSLRSRRPDGSFGGNAEATFGNYGRRDVQLAVNVPVVNDVLDVRLAYQHRDFDGFARIGATSPTLTVGQQSALVGYDLSKYVGRRVGGDTKDSFRGVVRYRPMDGVEANLIVTHVKEKGDGSPQIDQTLAGSLFGRLGFPGRDPFGDSRYGIAGDGSDPFVSGSQPGFIRQTGTDYLADLTVDVAGGTWYTMVDYHTDRTVINTDTDGELVDLFSSTRVERFAQFQIESRYSHKFFADKLDVMGGVFYLRDNFDLFQRLALGFGSPANPAASPPIPATPLYQFAVDGRSGANTLQRDGQVRKSISPYAQVTWNVTDELRLTGALRYSVEDRDAFDILRQAPSGPAGAAALSNSFDVLSTQVRFATTCGVEKTRSTSWSPGLSADYKLAEDVMVFASWQRAYKSGGVNVNGTCGSFHQPYEDERVDNYEAGIKAQFFDRKLLLNLNAFRAEYSNLQESTIRFDPNSAAAAETYTSNAAGATIYGLEAETRFRLTPDFTLYATVGYLHAAYSDFCANLVGVTVFTGAAPTSSCGKVVIQAPGQALVDTDNSNLKLPFAPAWDGEVGANYRIDLSDRGSLTADVSVHYTSGLQTQVTNAPRTNRAAMTKVDASLTWQDASKRYRVILWGRNLNDEVERKSALVVAPLFTFATPTPPRTFGVTLSGNF